MILRKPYTKMIGQTKKWSEMNVEELRQATRAFDREDLSPPKSLGKADRPLLRQASEHAQSRRPARGSTDLA